MKRVDKKVIHIMALRKMLYSENYFYSYKFI